MHRIKRINGRVLYDLICDRDNLALAVKNASKDHAKDPDVIAMKLNPEPFIEMVRHILLTRSFHYGKFHSLTIRERGKVRHLCYSQTFPDRVIQHAVLQIVGPILLGTCIRDTYAAQIGKGTHRCSMQVRRDRARDPEGTKYVLKGDIRHYFESIDRNILFNMIKRKIKCADTLEILRRFIFEVPGRRGLPIGLYSSQIFSTFYLSEFDHYCKEILHIRFYKRYADDLVFMSDSKTTLHRVRKIIEDVLWKKYRLRLKKNWHISPFDGLDFVGYVHYTTHVKLRKRNKIAFIRVCNAVVKHCARGHDVTRQLHATRSYLGMIGWCNGRRLTNLYSDRMIIAMEFGADLL